MKVKHLEVTVPWGLSHYFAPNGFHPIYRALIDYKPEVVKINSLDNVKLFRKIQKDRKRFEYLFSQINKLEQKIENLNPKLIERKYKEYFFSPNMILTELINGDIEFHHSAPFASLKRPFIFHCEAFAPIFMPFAGQGNNKFLKNKDLKEYYKKIFAHKYCLGIMSHIPETLESIKLFFNDPIISRKLVKSRIGLSMNHFSGVKLFEKNSLSNPIFLYINSAHQNPKNFTKRGGHLVLRFWKEYIKSGREGMLILRYPKTSFKELEKFDIDFDFIKSECGKSIIWSQDYLSNYEMNKLISKSNFFLLPSASLHSVSLMQAMTFGTVPVVTDTLGIDSFVTNNKDAIVLEGMNSAIWQKDDDTGVLFDNYKQIHTVDDDLLSQMLINIYEAVDNSTYYNKLSQNAIRTAKSKFSGKSFSKDFWRKTLVLYQNNQKLFNKNPIHPRRKRLLDNCLISGDQWSRVFESPTQPMNRSFLGRGSVWELSGNIIQVNGNPKIELEDWSVMSSFLGRKQMTFAYELCELNSEYIAPKEIIFKDKNKLIEKLGIGKGNNVFSKVLKRFDFSPSKKLLQFIKCMRYRMKSSKSLLDIDLIIEGFHGLNIIRYFHIYYAIPQPEGQFILEKVKANSYSVQFSSLTFDGMINQIVKNIDNFEVIVSEPHLNVIISNYYGFKISKFLHKYYAILNSEGALDLNKFQKKEYSIYFIGVDADQVKNKINNFIIKNYILLDDNYLSFKIIKYRETYCAICSLKNDINLKNIFKNGDTVYFSGRSSYSVRKQVIDYLHQNQVLVVQNYHGFNIIDCMKSSYAILQSEGKFDITMIDKGTYNSLLSGENQDEVKLRIREYLNDNVTPIEKNFHNFNIIKCMDNFYAILQSEGEFDITKVDKKAYNPLFSGESQEEVKLRIREFLNDNVRLIREGFHNFNIIKCMNDFYATLQSEGEFDITKVDKGDYHLVFSGKNLEEVITQINDYIKQESKNIKVSRDFEVNDFLKEYYLPSLSQFKSNSILSFKLNATVSEGIVYLNHNLEFRLED
ncbi:hypothetical protein P0136_08070 [Lentisphaerota bacterium ZTH]|nr:glycosyltransferase [Lentisphaerota bacterium]WET05319.1 hypothetical protein P0136_08070 [Lentisphaerota bacterium ZTH]